jgi:protein phosphatase
VICPACSQENAEGTTVCTACGADLNGSTERETTAELNLQDFAREWQEKAERARDIRVDVKVAAKTDLGRVRENNEDKFEFFEPEDPEILANKGCLYAVADGMGGHSAGQIASEIGLKTIIDTYYSDNTPDIPGSIKYALARGNSHIYDTAQAIIDRQGMGTTVTLVVIRGDEAYFGQVGDSRGYLIQNGKIRQVTQDHSWVAEQVRRGALTEEEAESSPFRNVITRSLGAAPTVEPDVFIEQIEEGDIIVLCSDGLSGKVSKDETGDIAGKEAPSQAAWDLIELANSRGGNDNITVMIVAVREIGTEKQTDKPRGLGRLFGRK